MEENEYNEWLAPDDIDKEIQALHEESQLEYIDISDDQPGACIYINQFNKKILGNLAAESCRRIEWFASCYMSKADHYKIRELLRFDGEFDFIGRNIKKISKECNISQENIWKTKKSERLKGKQYLKR